MMSSHSSIFTRTQDVYTVQRLNHAVRQCLESSFGLIWLEGEVSNLIRPSSGHIYFSVKDDQAQVRCVMFRAYFKFLDFVPQDGQQVLLSGRVSLYETRGEFQFIVEQMEELGSGALQREFEALKRRLFEEGLFDDSTKLTLPAFPRRIGVITSPSGAAIRDVLTVLRKRFPAIPILIYPTQVQGNGAGGEIAQTIDLACRRQDCDVLLLVRGGGSLEDLWAFNEEAVARSIHACHIPIVTGIGHEIDVTIADFAADQRAPTPSAAAELVSPDREEWQEHVAARKRRLMQTVQNQLSRKALFLASLEKRLAQLHPERRMHQQAQRRDELELRLRRIIDAQLQLSRKQLAHLHSGLLRNSPTRRIDLLTQRYRHLRERLLALEITRLHRAQLQLAAVSRALEAVSPLRTLGRGYAIVRRLPDGLALTNANQVTVGDAVEAHLACGSLTCRVEYRNLLDLDGDIGSSPATTATAQIDNNGTTN